MHLQNENIEYLKKRKWITIVELGSFPAAASSLLNKEEHMALITHLANAPEQGDEIPETGGLRKLRWHGKGKGKRGGLRVIYYFYNESAPVFLLALYAKGRQEDLTALQKKQLTKIAHALKIECKKTKEVKYEKSR